MFGLEVSEVLLIFLILGGFLVFCHLRIIAFFRRCGLLLEGFPNGWLENLPSFSYQLRDFSEREILALQFFSYFCPKLDTDACHFKNVLTIRKNDIG